MQEEFRHPVQFDIAGPKVDTLAGSLISDLPDPTWVPVQGQKGILTESIAETYFTDKDLFNYDDVLLKVFRDGLVHCGDLEISEDYKYHVPRIRMDRVIYSFLVWDPYWLTDDDRDAEVCFRVAYMTAAQLVRKYKHKTDELLREIKEYKRDKTNYQYDIARQQERKEIGRVGDEFQVIEKHYLEYIRTTRLLGRREGEQQWIPFPINKDRAYLEAFAELNEIDWTTVIEDTYEDKISYVTTVCRELSNVEIQVEKKNKIQVNGLPFHHFATRRWNGKNMGIVESIADVEDTINKRESLITEIISKAGGGSTLVNENLFPDPRKRQDWVKNKNKPGHSEFVDLDGVKTVLQHMVPAQAVGDAAQQIERMYKEVLPLVSRVSDSLAAASNSKDSGILFERKFQVNMIANTLMNRNMRQFINNIAESYFFQWQITYGDHEQEVKFRDGKNIILNEEKGGLVYNDVKSVPRCRIVIAENTKSQTYQMRWRSIWSEMLQSISPEVAPAHYMLALKNFFETIQVNEDDKATVKILNEMVMMIARLQLVSQATQFQTAAQKNTLDSMNIDMQMQQLMQQMQGAQQQPQAQGHNEPQQGSPQVQYPKVRPNETPQGGSEINPQPTEGAQMQSTQPAMTGAAV